MPSDRESAEGVVSPDLKVLFLPASVVCLRTTLTTLRSRSPHCARVILVAAAAPIAEYEKAVKVSGAMVHKSAKCLFPYPSPPPPPPPISMVAITRTLSFTDEPTASFIFRPLAYLSASLSLYLLLMTTLLCLA